MNILFLSTHLNTGGITSYLLTLAKGLRRRGHRIFLATSGGNTQEEFKKIGADLIPLNIHTKSELDPRIYLAMGPLKNLVQENRIDVIHAQTRITQVMGELLHKITKRPYISTCHGFFKKRLSRRIFPCWGNRVIAISEAVSEHLHKDFGILEEKIVLIPNGIDLEEFPLIKDEQKQFNRQKFHLGDNPIIGIIARLSDVKGQDILIWAMKKVLEKIPQAQLLLIGEGKEETALRAHVKDLKLENHVHFYPIVNKTAESLSLLDVFVMPSRQEGLGLSVMEAQASGLAVVASRVGGLPSLIEHEKTGLLVSPEDIEGLADAIIRVIQDKQLAYNLGSAARAFIQKKYSADRMVGKTLEVYETLV